MARKGGDISSWWSDTCSYVSGSAPSRPGSTTSSAQSECFSDIRINAIRLRECLNPEDLESVLFDVWKARPDVSGPFDIPKAGTVRGLDVSELLFSSDTVCKKLISFIRFPQSTKEARMAAMDVYAWFCTQPSVLKSLFVEQENILEWCLSLALDRDDNVAVAGVRGLLQLVSHEMYCYSIHQSGELMRVFCRDNPRTQVGRQVSVYACMLFCSILWKVGPVDEIIELVAKLCELSSLPQFETLEERYWLDNCLQAAVILADDRVRLTKVVEIKGIAQTEDAPNRLKLLDNRVKLYRKLQQKAHDDEKNVEVDTWLTKEETLDAIIIKLNQKHCLFRSDVLQLLLTSIGDKPSLFFDKMLRKSWSIFEKLMQEGSREEKVIVLIILALGNTLTPPSQKRNVPCNDGALAIVQTLLNNLDEQTVAVLNFLWVHFDDVHSAFLEAGVIPAVLSFFFQSQVVTQGSQTSRIGKDLLANLLQDMDHGGGGLQQQLLTELKAVIDKGDLSQPDSNVSLVLDLLAEVTKSTNSIGVVSWLVQEGGMPIISRLEDSFSRLKTQDTLLNSLILIVNNILKAKMPHNVDRNFFLRKLILSIDLAAVIIALAKNNLQDALDNFKNHSWAEEFLITEKPDIKDLVLPDGPVFYVPRVYFEKMLNACKGRKTSFLHFILWLLFNMTLRFDDENSTWLIRFKDFVCSCVDEWQKEDDAECSVMLLKCVAALKATSVWGLPFGTTKACTHRLRFEPFWDLMIEHGNGDGLEISEKRRLMLLLKTSYTSGPHDKQHPKGENEA